MFDSTNVNCRCDCNGCICPVVDTDSRYKSNNHDVRIDFYPSPYRQSVIWGTVYDDYRNPLSGSLVRLLQCSDEKNTCCIVIGQTYSDFNGYYEIPIPLSFQGRYRIEVTNPSSRKEPFKRKNNICYY